MKRDGSAKGKTKKKVKFKGIDDDCIFVLKSKTIFELLGWKRRKNKRDVKGFTISLFIILLLLYLFFYCTLYICRHSTESLMRVLTVINSTHSSSFLSVMVMLSCWNTFWFNFFGIFFRFDRRKKCEYFMMASHSIYFFFVSIKKNQFGIILIAELFQILLLAKAIWFSV